MYWLLDRIADFVGPGILLATLFLDVLLQWAVNAVFLGFGWCLWQITLHPREFLALGGGALFGMVAFGVADALCPLEVGPLARDFSLKRADRTRRS